MKTVVIIPVRLASTRLPNKPLADINGKTMTQRIYEHVSGLGLWPVYIAAADQEIIDDAKRYGGNAVLTDPDLPSGTDRIAAALAQIDPDGTKFDIVVNFQGDAVNTRPEIVKDLVDLLISSKADFTTPAMVMSEENKDNPAAVKIAMGLHEGETTGRALYFSRARIPFTRDGVEGPLYHHIGLYVYRAVALKKFVSLAPGVLEMREKLEQLRALEHGMSVYVKLIDQLKIHPHAPADVDTPVELEEVRQVFK